MPYEYVDEITSDVMFRVRGQSLEEVFVDAAKAMLGVMYDLGEVKADKEVEVRASGDNEKDLLYAWLSAVLTESEVSEMFFSEFEIKSLDGKDIVAIARGEPARDELVQTQVKGVTLHKFDLKKVGSEWQATVVVDI